MNCKNILSFALILPLLLFSQLIYSQSKTLKSISINGVKTEVEVLTKSPIAFYKTTATNKYYIENIKNNSGVVYLNNLAYPTTKTKNRGKLLVIFNDCVAVRSKTNKSDITIGTVFQLIDEYQNCDNYTSTFELSQSDKRAQSFAKQKSIIDYDFGLGYTFQELNFTVNDNPTFSDSDSGLLAFFSVNFSPSHLRNLTGRLFYDVALQYNSKSSYEISNFRNKISSVQLTLGPKFYFLKNKTNFNPFIGASIGAIVLDYDYKDNSSMLFNTIDSSDTKLIYGFEIGTQILTNFEISLNYFPDYKFDIIRDDSLKINSELNNLNIKLGYKF